MEENKEKIKGTLMMGWTSKNTLFPKPIDFEKKIVIKNIETDLFEQIMLLFNPKKEDFILERKREK